MTFKAVITIAILAAVAIGGRMYVTGYSGAKIASPDARTSDEPMVKVALPTLTAEQTKGETLFNQKCAVCHAKNAAGQQGVAPPLIYKIYQPRHHADIAFVLAAKNGVRSHHWTFGNMPPIKGITDDEVRSIVSYIRALQRKNGIS